MAGSKARARGAECQCVDSWPAVTAGLLALGRSRSSVEDLNDCLVLFPESEKLELRRCLRGLETSAKVDARPKGRWRRGDRLDLPVVFPVGPVLPLIGGLMVRSCGAIIEET